jgi:hypothetical protein
MNLYALDVLITSSKFLGADNGLVYKLQKDHYYYFLFMVALMSSVFAFRLKTYFR